MSVAAIDRLHGHLVVVGVGQSSRLVKQEMVEVAEAKDVRVRPRLRAATISVLAT